MESDGIALLGQNPGSVHTGRAPTDDHYRPLLQCSMDSSLALVAGVRVRCATRSLICLEEVRALVAGHARHNFACSIFGELTDVVRIGVKSASQRNKI